MKKTACVTFVLSVLFFAADSNVSSSQLRGRQDIRARARAEAEREQRDRIQQELEAATSELVALTEILVDEVEKADGYTVSLDILESSDRIAELARDIEQLARTIHRRAQGR